ncbi:hypothetical protein KSP39_PZI018747 [Platanthera zijinensis]|uniref:ribose-phosphate diphosphokinase n=1 Tax=Platanthera zijinensis TaxID=2320716 RepID=A0AAP0B479_9ASPA
MASSFSISCPSTIASPAQSYHRRASITNSFPTIQCRISDQRLVSSAAPLPKDQSLPITPVPIPVLHGLDTGTDTGLRIFSGTANPALSQKIADHLGVKLVKVKRKRFADGEFFVQLQECIRGCNVFIVQPIGLTENVNLVELLMMVDVCRRASAKNVNAVIPYFGYAKADIKLVILDYLASKTFCPNDLVVVCLSHYGVENARAFAKSLSGAVLVINDEELQGHNAAEVMNVDGDARGKVAIVLDDMIDSAAFLFLVWPNISHMMRICGRWTTTMSPSSKQESMDFLTARSTNFANWARICNNVPLDFHVNPSGQGGLVLLDI